MSVAHRLSRRCTGSRLCAGLSMDARLLRIRAPRGIKRRARTIVAAAVAAVALIVAHYPFTAAAQSYPAKPVRILVGFTAGTANDIIGRILATKFTELLGQQFFVDNVAGASGTIAGAAVVAAPPDGYTLLMGGTALAMSPYLFQRLRYDPLRDLAPISLVATLPNVLVVHPSLPANNLKQLIAMAKAQPGKLDYSVSGKGSGGHLSMELFKSMAGIDVGEIQYKSSAQALSDVVGGQVSMTSTSMTLVLPLIKAGRLRPLAVSGRTRSVQLPDIPTVAEAAGLKGYDANSWYGLFAPANTPPQVLARLSSTIQRMLQLPDTKERLEAQGAEPVGTTPEEFAAFLQGGAERWSKLVRQLNLRLD